METFYMKTWITYMNIYSEEVEESNKVKLARDGFLVLSDIIISRR